MAKKIVKMLNSFFIVIVLMILAGNLSGQNFEYKLTNNSTDPTEIRTRADLFFAQVTSRASNGRNDFLIFLNGPFKICCPVVEARLPRPDISRLTFSRLTSSF